MRSIRIFTGLVVAALLVCVTQSLFAQDNAQFSVLQQKLKDQIVLTKIDSNGDIAVAGSVVVLQKDGLWMCGMTGAGPFENTYKNGKFSVGRFGWGMLAALLKIDMNSIPQLKFVSGDKFWITAYSVNKNGIHLTTLSDPIDDVRYYTNLKIPFSKGSVPSVDDVMKAVAEVVSVEPSENADQGAPPETSATPTPALDLGHPTSGHPGNGFLETSAPAPTPSFAPVAPPPPPIDAVPAMSSATSALVLGNHSAKVLPPPHGSTAIAPSSQLDAPPKSISLGQTKDEVLGAFGQPMKVVNLGVKEIDYYSDMKVIFIQGKVADVQ